MWLHTFLEIQFCIVRCLRAPLRPLLLIHLDLSGIFFLIMMGQRTFVARVGGRKNFSSEQTFPRLNQDVEKSQDWAEEIEASGPLAQARARTP